MRRLLLAALAFGVASLASACSDPSTITRPNPLTISGPNLAKPVAPPTLDGVIGDGEYDGAATLTFNADLPAGGTTPVTVYITHDKTYMYLAVTFDRGSAFHLNDVIAFAFDNDNDGVREDGDDIVLTDPTDPAFVVHPGADYYFLNGGAANQSDIFPLSDGGTIDVSSVFGVSGNTGVFEFRHDLNSADDAHDFSIDPIPMAETVGVLVEVALEADPAGSNTYTTSFTPSSTTYCHLTIGKKTTTVTCP
jgi:hypothetical protein